MVSDRERMQSKVRFYKCNLVPSLTLCAVGTEEEAEKEVMLGDQGKRGYTSKLLSI